MSSIITYLLMYNQYLHKQIYQLLLFIAKHIPLSQLENTSKDCQSPDYNKFKVDKLPVVKAPEYLDYKALLKDYKSKHGKELKPVKSRGGTAVPKTAVCHRCGAPHQYLYDNNGGRGQLLCKVCGLRFNFDKNDFKIGALTCPYCGHILVKKKNRKNFNIHKCVNDHCSYYLDSLKTLPKDLPQDKRYLYKLRYLYREFTTDFFEMDLTTLPKNASGLNFKKFNSHILGLSLTYNVNLGLSFRKTADALREIHGIVISHTSIRNYALTAASLVQPYVDTFEYKTTVNPYLAADETYIKVKGVKYYVWFVMDAIKRTLLSYHVSANRDAGACVLALRKAFAKFKVFPGDKLRFVADGYPAYNLAQQQFQIHDMNFNLTQVIGLANDDEVSEEYRWLKQEIERLNRTFKMSYRPTNGYATEDGACTHVSLFVAYYNFLRPHAYTYWQPLNVIPELSNLPNMPAKWQKLLELSQAKILELSRVRSA